MTPLPKRRGGLRRTLLAVTAALLLSPPVVTMAAQPAAALPPGYKGIQAGAVLNDDCSLSVSGQKISGPGADTAVLNATKWLRIDFRIARTCRDAYVNLLAGLPSHISIIGLLDSEFSNAEPVDFAQHAVEIACDGGYGRVTVWEIRNEPNHNDTWLEPARFGEFVARSAYRIHSECHDEVISGGLVGDSGRGPVWTYITDTSAAIAAHPEWSNSAYTSLNAAVDGVGIHPYSYARRMHITEEPHQPLADFLWHMTGERGNPVSGERIYVTEFGYRMQDNNIDELKPEEMADEGEQCDNLVEGFQQIAASGIYAATWFTLMDWDDEHRRFGLYNINNGPERLARYGYVDGNCAGPTAGVFNEEADQLQWTSTALAGTAGRASLAATSYEIAVAPPGSSAFSIIKTSSQPFLPMYAFNPPLAVGVHRWKVTRITDGRRYPSPGQWTFNYLGRPSPPTGAYAAGGSTGTFYTINWTDNAISETGYEISNSFETRIAPANATSLTWTGATPGVKDCFRVRSYNAFGPSYWALETCATTPSLPTAPSNVTATVLSGTSVRVNWADLAGNETGYQVSDGTTTVSLAANSTTYTWSGLTMGTTKCFTVRSYNTVGYSPWSGSVCATLPTIPIAPAGQTATVASGTSITLTWQDKSTNEWGFEISNGTTTNVVGANSTSYTWGGLANGTYLCLMVRSYNNAGYSAWTPYACATTPTIPVAPNAQTATVVSGTSIRINWADRSANEWGFEISNGTTSTVVGANSTSYTWGGLANGTYMCFMVRAYNQAGYSPWTPYACATTPTIPIAPAGQTATPISGTQITVTWQDRSNNETSFQLYNGVSYLTLPANTTSYTWGGLANGTYMCFSIKAVNLAGQSASTPYACATTPTVPAVPTNQTATPISTSQIRVNWVDRSTNEIGFQVFDGVTYWTVPANTTVFTRTGLASKKYMCFAIRSYNSVGYSAFTPYACATTF
ncbi:hypothetical protein F4553_007084 [Allocatelliglobosispora scoriae]|uniref:Fibronectin type-III domain-containing protein n=1 Tax=Allocatelliglobosispora scoriae TaxID=643052 RepID=A0A841C3W0_9ACTN|nr:fibronectin type III domain-containing protein [Allocatelliglobosispora scoriae]MBB5873650.1 hypothetical protein [Allocatelliglobosispora scoriae]